MKPLGPSATLGPFEIGRVASHDQQGVTDEAWDVRYTGLVSIEAVRARCGVRPSADEGGDVQDPLPPLRRPDPALAAVIRACLRAAPAASVLAAALRGRVADHVR